MKGNIAMLGLKSKIMEMKKMTYPSFGRWIANSLIVVLFASAMGAIIFGIDTLSVFLQSLLLK